jgi:ubiquinone/menaquinone biosynthesis C-methylase UbiE
MTNKNNLIDLSKQAFRNKRVAHWDSVAAINLKLPSIKEGYHEHLAKVYRFLVPPGSRVLEIGCGHGDLLAALRPSYGVGLDISTNMLDKGRKNYPNLAFINMDIHDIDRNRLPKELDNSFDFVILSDLVNELWDVLEALQGIRCLFTSNTRLLLNFHSHLWEKPAQFAQRCGFMTPRLEQNWLTLDDMKNLLDLAEFEVIRVFDEFLWPWPTPVVEPLCNRWLAKLFPFCWLCLTHFMVCRSSFSPSSAKVSVIIPARNEAGNIKPAIERIPEMGSDTEIIFVEGNSTDGTWEMIQEIIPQYPQKKIRAFRQDGHGKGDAVRIGFDSAGGDILMILDADLTVAPETLPQFYDIMISGKAEFVNGVRLVYPQDQQAMRFFNLLGNKFFSIAFSWLLGRNIKDTLCGTKVLRRENYMKIAANRGYFGDFDPFGDFDLLFGAAKLNLKIVDLPIRYRERVYGNTNISRWRDGWILIKMLIFAAHRIKFVP